MKILFFYLLTIGILTIYLVIKKEKFIFKRTHGSYFLPEITSPIYRFDSRINHSMKYGRLSSKYKKIHKRSGF